MDYQLAGKTAVVSGAGGAILGAVSRLLADEGAQVAIWDLSPEAARATADAVSVAGGTALAVTCDVTSRNSVREALDQTLASLQRVDILINGAGGNRPSTTTSNQLSFFDIEPDDIRSVMDLNYLGTVLCCQELGRLMARQGSGSIVNVTSVAGVAPLTRALAYSNGKAAANSFTQWLAVHMAQNYSRDIRVNAVAPGFVLTDQNRFLLIDAQSGAMTERGRQIMEAVPVARYGTPQEVAQLVVFLASDRASFIHGAVVPVDGGFSAHSGV